MMGTKLRDFAPLPNLSLEELVPSRWASQTRSAKTPAKLGFREHYPSRQ